MDECVDEGTGRFAWALVLLLDSLPEPHGAAAVSVGCDAYLHCMRSSTEGQLCLVFACVRVVVFMGAR